MFKILHFALHKNVSPGVLNQLWSERQAASVLGGKVIWDTVVFSHSEKKYDFQFSVEKAINRPQSLFSDAVNYVNLRKVSFDWFRKHSHNYDAVILRYRSGDLFLFKESNRFENVYTVHHTKEIQEAKTRYGKGGRFEEVIENYFGTKTIQRVKGIIGVTQEIVDYELQRINNSKPSYCYPNGISLDDIPVALDKRANEPKLLFVASGYTKWHGLDLVIESFKKENLNFVLHVVGPIKLDNENDKRIIFHGESDRSYILNLIAECDVGLGPFALDRIGMKEACQLKVREYLAAGLPVYSSFKDAGIPSDFPFYKIDELELSKIIQFAENCRKIDRQEVRLCAEPYIDKVELMRKLIYWLEENS